MYDARMPILHPPTAGSFVEILIATHKAVVVKYTATWCAPCKAYKTQFKKVSEAPAFAGLAFVEIDIDVHLNEDVTNVPTTLIFAKDKKGKPKEFDRIAGAVTAKELTETINAVLDQLP